MDSSLAQQATQREPSLATKATRGSLWVGAGKYVNYVVSFVSSIALARLLTPEDFGVVALATATFGILSRMNSVGISVAIIQREDEDPAALSTLFWAQTSIAMAIFVLAVIIGLFSSLFDALTMRIFLIVAAFCTASIVTYPSHAILRRHFQFKQLTVVDIGLGFLSSAAAVAMAYLGLGVWALVWPAMIALLLKGLLYWRASGWRPQFVFDWDVLRDLRRFAFSYFSYGVLEEFVHKIDDVLLGKLSGVNSLGFYSKAYSTSEMFHANVGTIIATTALPLFSCYQDDLQRLRRAYELIIKALLKLGGLFYVTLAVLAYEAIGLLYGQKWQPMVPILWAMLPYALLLPVFTLSSYPLIAVGRISDATRAFAVMAGVLLIALLPGILILDAVGAALAVDVMILVGLVHQFVKISQVFEVNLPDTVYKPFGVALIHGILLVIVKQWLMPLTPWLITVVISVISVGLFAALTWAFDRPWLLRDVRLVYATVRGHPVVV
jgi:O-antigen/teichoic acid export membrane protein